MESFMSDRRYWLWLSLKFKPGSATCDNLLYFFGNDPKLIYEADAEAISAFRKNDKELISVLSDKDMTYADRILDYCERENIGILTPDSKYYPSSLTRITGRPPVIYYKGRLPDFTAHPTIGVVGTRDVTPYGSSSAYTISHDLASAKSIVVSGLALGSDTAAHRGALDAGGHTVAFLGCGIDVVYPKANERLMQEIAMRGTIMTDYPPASRPEGWHFPIRNRLISGISHGVLVVEAAEKSGALITASHALKQGKLLYAVPGKVGELASVGTNRLIRDGAKMVTSAADILSDFSGLFETKRKDYQNRESSGHTHNSSNTDARRKTSGSLSLPDGRSVSEEDFARAYMSIETDIPHFSRAYREDVQRTAVPRITSEDRAYEMRPTALNVSRDKLENTVSSPEPNTEGLSEDEAQIIRFLCEHGRSSSDTIINSTGMSLPKLLTAITMLEIKQRIVQLPGGYLELKNTY